MASEPHAPNVPSTSTNGLESITGRRKDRSCDPCRQKKVRCDGIAAIGMPCTKCEASNTECTYTAPSRTRPPPASTRLKQLQERQKRLEELVQQLLPGVDVSGDFDLDKVTEGIVSKQAESPDFAAFQFCRRSGEHWDVQPTEDDGAFFPCGEETATRTSVGGQFYGRSSHAVLLKSLWEWKVHEQGGGELVGSLSEWKRRVDARWQAFPWEESALSLPPVRPSKCTFPEQHLMNSLIDLYFDHVNLFTPLLHRPTFDRLFRDDLHIEDASFGAVVLLVCAIGARFSKDERVLFNGATLSAGLQWFNQASDMDENFMAPASLYNIQADFLRAEFLRGGNPSARAWSFIGIGLRRAQDVGAHRWQTFRNQKSSEREQWTRAWWCLVVSDRILSSTMGRPCITDGWDFDVGLPTECDDEYWDHPDPEKRWKQPDGVPSKISFFISHINQTTMISSAQVLLYSIGKARHAYMLGAIADWDRKVVIELDSALNKWVDNMPDHLRNPHSQTHPIFHRQSIALHAELYHLQVLMHRPFLIQERKSPMTAVSFAVCTNAARACSRLLDTEDESCRDVVYRIQLPIFTSAIVLLLSVWSGKRMGLEGAYAKEMRNIEKCMVMLSHAERCWLSAGQLGDVLRSLVEASDLARPGHEPSSSDPTLSTTSHPPDTTSCESAPQQQGYESLFDHGMPLYTEDLAKIPVYSGYPGQPGAAKPWIADIMSNSNNPPPTFPSQAPLALDGGNLGSLPQVQEGSQLDGSNVFGLGMNHNHEPLMPDIFDPDTMRILSSVPNNWMMGDWCTFVDHINEAQMCSGLGQMGAG